MPKASRAKLALDAGFEHQKSVELSVKDLALKSQRGTSFNDKAFRE
jgi:hypothetical protein